ncbi:MAG: nucleotidyltransferase family protein [Acidobacteriota bacterium]|nr:nucleotidyltransferase family protein [Acidobacteriota bacterium]
MRGRPADDAALVEALCRGLHPARPDVEALGAVAASPRGLDLALEHLVVGLVARELGAAGALASLPEDRRQRWRLRLMEVQRQRATLDEAADAAVAALAEAGIVPVLLKGAALGRTVYAEPHLRPMSDVDLLIDAGRLAGALAALARAGMRVPPEEDVDFWRRAYYNLPVEWTGRGSVQIEMHWSISQPDRHPVAVAGLLRRAVSLPAGVGRVLSPVDLLLHQALHHSYHFFQPKLIWVHDLALLHRDPPPLEPVLERARQWGMLRPLALSCLQVEKVYPGCLTEAYRRWAADYRPAVRIERRFRSADPVALLDGWQRRRRQLVLSFLMLDGRAQRLGALAGWVGRVLRFGDREGHRRLEAFRPREK